MKKSIVRKEKRGRKGSRVIEAFKMIPKKPVPLLSFCERFKVSKNTLSQTRRFGVIKYKVHMVKKDGVYYIWKEAV